MKFLAKLIVTNMLFLSGLASAEDVKPFEIRFCPAAQVRTFPLESGRNVHSLLLQNVAIVSHAITLAEVVAVDIELLSSATAVDTRRFAGTDLMRLAAKGPKLQESGMLHMLAFQFCGSALIADGIVLAGPTLAPGQALLLPQQPFAFQGVRDALLVRAHLKIDGRDLEIASTIKIATEFSKTSFRFPLKGAWFAAVGPTMHTGHRWARPEEFAYDIAKLGQDDLSHRASGTRFQDYYAYSAQVIAAADGIVIAAVNDQPENAKLLRRPSEPADVYDKRMHEIQGELLSKGVTGIAGNYVMIDHGNSEYSLYAHLQPGSVRVKIGEHIKVGASLGKLGTSGNSTEPHLHFQVCDAPDALFCSGIPVQFQNVTLPYADYPRPLQSGDVLIAE